jgi:chemotaxis protein MotB
MKWRNRDHHSNHERWLVSYADFITLMFAFFVVMFASSQADRGKVQAFSEAISRALEEGRISARVIQMLGGQHQNARPAPAQGWLQTTHEPKPGTKLAELTPALKQLSSELREEIRKGRLQISLEPRGLVISLKEAAFFPSGDATVAIEGYATIERLANTIRKLPNPVRLEGHTDAIPIRNGRFASNWHLSAARSIAMLELLSSKFQVPASRLAAVGYADTIPVESNGTEDGRAKNRRVDVTILNEQSAVREPVSAR